MQAMLAAEIRKTLSATRIVTTLPLTACWIFCWASGRALARKILHEPERVSGKTVLDFGAGSGIVACDIDAASLAACAANAALNRTSLRLARDFPALQENVGLILAKLRSSVRCAFMQPPSAE